MMDTVSKDNNMDAIEKAYGSIARKAPSTSVLLLAGRNKKNVDLVKTAFKVMLMCDEEDRKNVRTMLNGEDC